MENLNDYPLQVATYWGAVNACYSKHQVNLSRAILVVAIPNIPAEVFWFNEIEIAPYWDAWELRVKQFWRRVGGCY